MFDIEDSIGGIFQEQYHRNLLYNWWVRVQKFTRNLWEIEAQNDVDSPVRQGGTGNLFYLFEALEALEHYNLTNFFRMDGNSALGLRSAQTATSPTQGLAQSLSRTPEGSPRKSPHSTRLLYPTNFPEEFPKRFYNI